METKLITKKFSKSSFSRNDRASFGRVFSQKFFVFFFILSTAVSAVAFTTHAAPTPTLNYQGKLVDTTNVAVPDGTYNMRFWLTTSATIATTSAVWTESLTGVNRVQVTNGLFSIMLGSTSPLTSVDFNQPLYLGVEIGSTTVTAQWDGEMSPRKILGTVPAAFEADRLDGLTSTQFARTDATTSVATSSTDTLFTITQNGVGDIFNLFDGSTEVFSVLDGGNVGVGTSSPIARFTVAGNSYFGGGITATGTISAVGLTVTASSTLGYASTTALTVSGNSFFTYASTTAVSGTNASFTYASTTGISGTNANITNATSTNIAATGSFKIGSDVITDITGTNLSITNGTLNVASTADGVSNWSFDGTRLTPTTTTAGIAIAGSSTIQNLSFVNGTGTNATTTNLRTTQLAIGSDFITDLTGTGLTVTGNALTCITATNAAQGCLTSTDWTTFNAKVASTSIDTSAELAALITDETGTAGSVVFSSDPLLAGFRSNASSTIGGGTGSTGLTINGGATTTGNAYFGGRIGIGTTTPSATLSLVGSSALNLFNFASSTGSSLLALDKRGALNFGVAGTDANIYINGGPTSTPVGNSVSNVALGNEAFSFVSAGGDGATDNIAVGFQALFGSSSVLMTGDGNTALGYQTLFTNTSGSHNNALGITALVRNTTGSHNNALGYQTLLSNVSGSYNNALGYQALGNNSSGSENNSLGYQSLFTNTTGIGNNALGTYALYFNTSGSYNTAIGFNALAFNTAGTSSVAIGPYALTNNTVGASSTAIGARSGYTNSIGSNNTYVGDESDSTAGNLTNVTALGSHAKVRTSNSLVLGGTGIWSTNVVTGTNTPFAKFSIQNNYGSTTALFDIATTTSAAYATSSLFRVGHDGRVSIGSTTPESLLLTLQKTGITGAGVNGIKEYFQFTNSTASAIYYGDNAYIVNAPTATSTLVGKIIRIEDTSTLGNTVRGLEVQAHRGVNTKGENTGISAFGRTFGLRGTTEGDAGDTFIPAGVFADLRGTTQGNAIRGYSGTITTSNLAYLFHDTSAFTGTGLLMNFGNSGGSFAATSSAKFLDLQVGGTSKFMIAANGSTTIGDGVVSASLRVPFGGICVDNDGSCISTTTGQIRSVTAVLGNSDLAEMYFSSDALEAGEIVSLSGGLSVKRAQEGAPQNIIGVVSTKPGSTLGFDDTSLVKGETGYPIALKGRVPIRLSTENGPIVKGDRIALSSIPGIGMKATESDTIVGIALEDYSGEFAYSAGFINQFGDDIARKNVTPQNQNTDLRTQDGCSYGGGVAQGETPCEKEIVKAPKTPKESTEDHLAAVKALRTLPAEEMVVDGGEVVAVGQAIMFVQLEEHIAAKDMDVLAALNATSTLLNGNGEETLFERLKSLAQGFVDGVLSVLELKADRVEVKDELCVDGVCVTADDLRALLNSIEREAGNAPDTEQPADDTNEPDIETPPSEEIPEEVIEEEPPQDEEPTNETEGEEEIIEEEAPPEAPSEENEPAEEVITETTPTE